MSSKKMVLYALFAIVVGAIVYLAGVLNGETVVVAEDSNASVLEAMASLQASVDAVLEENRALHSKVDALKITLASVADDVSAARDCACNNPCGYVYTVTEYITVPLLVSPVYTKTLYVTETVQVTEVVRVPAQESLFDSDDDGTVVIRPAVTPSSRTPSPTPSPSRTPSATPSPSPSPTPSPTRTPDADRDKGVDKPKCNQGVGNGPEGCSPGKSDVTVNPRHPHKPNDEGQGDVPGYPGRKQEAKARK